MLGQSQVDQRAVVSIHSIVMLILLNPSSYMSPDSVTAQYLNRWYLFIYDRRVSFPCSSEGNRQSD